MHDICGALFVVVITLRIETRNIDQKQKLLKSGDNKKMMIITTSYTLRRGH